MKKALFRSRYILLIAVLVEIAIATLWLSMDAAYINQKKYYAEKSTAHVVLNDVTESQKKDIESLTNGCFEIAKTLGNDNNIYKVFIYLENPTEKGYNEFYNFLSSVDGFKNIEIDKTSLFYFEKDYEVNLYGGIVVFAIYTVLGTVVFAVSILCQRDEKVNVRMGLYVLYSVAIIAISDFCAILIYWLLQHRNGGTIYISPFTMVFMTLNQAVVITIACLLERKFGNRQIATLNSKVSMVLSYTITILICVLIGDLYAGSISKRDITHGTNYFSVEISMDENFDELDLEKIRQHIGMDYVISKNSYVSSERNENITDSNGVLIPDYFISPTNTGRVVLLSKYTYEGDLSIVSNSNDSIIINNYINNKKVYDFKVGDELGISVLNKKTGEVISRKYKVAAILTDHPTTKYFEVYMPEDEYSDITGEDAFSDAVFFGASMVISEKEINSLYNQLESCLYEYGYENASVENLYYTRLFTDQVDNHILYDIIIIILVMVACLQTVSVNSENMVLRSGRLSGHNKKYVVGILASVGMNIITTSIFFPIIFQQKNQYPIFKEYKFPIIWIVICATVDAAIKYMAYFLGKRYNGE